MPNIKFSYPFKKLYEGGRIINSAKLIQVIELDLTDVTQELRDYDTDFDKYILPKKGKYLLLIFQKNRTDLFTTMRRYTPEKLEYYQAQVGQIFTVTVQ